MNIKRTVLRVEEIKMSDLKKGDKFLLIEDGSVLYDNRLLVADADGTVNDKDVGSVEAHII